ncbi:hypothetical protein ABZ618_22860 [Streptomyces roseolus]|uniref:hypothetical protein n=1 Tax=Streptomyces roseolus TaxID=67358 RepID=UPI0033DFFE99
MTVRCGACGREGEWPHPELGCACGAVLRIPVAPAPGGQGHGTGHGHGAEEGYGSDEGDGSEGDGSEGDGPVPHVPEGSAGPGPLPYAPDGFTGPGSAPYAPDGFTSPGSAPYAPDDVGDGPVADGSGLFAALDDGARREPGPVSDWFGAPPRSFAERYPAHIPPPPTVPSPSPGRGVYRPVTIRTARDAVAAAATYLHWLGFREIVQPEDKRSPGVDLRGPGLVAQVDPSTRPAGLRAVECLWLNGLSASAVSVFFSLAGYTPEARSRAAEIRLPLFVLDLTGTPQPVNDAADELTSGGAV